MGIPHFYRWLKNKGYKGVLRRNVPRYVSSFSLDANGIIHQCAQLVYAYGEHEDPARKKLIQKADPRMLEAEFYNVVSTKLQEIIAQVRPQDTLVIAIDGVAPMGKITQQRQRRFRSALESSGGSVFDSNCITPATDFMIRLDNFLQRWIVSYQPTLPPKVIYSSHMVPGEGEHKILDLMRSGEINGDGAHVLYGMDADLIMLSLIAPLDQISLMREDIRDVIDIDTLKLSLSEELKLPTAINDFVVMVFTIGNDFLPHMPALEDLDEAIATLVRVYQETGVGLTTEDDLDWVGLAKYLTALSQEEPLLLERESKRDVKYPSRMLQAASKRTEKIAEGDKMTIGQKITYETQFDFNIFRGAWYQNAIGPKGRDFNVVKQLLPGYNFGVSMDKVVGMCHRYLVGMAWVYNYYTKGAIAINADYVYGHHHTPLISDLTAVLSQLKSVKGYMAHPHQVVLNPIHQLLSVLPLKSKDLLPKEVAHLMTKDSPIADLYPETAIIERDGKNAEWQGIVLISFVDPARVMKAVNTTTRFTIERAQLYSQGDNIVLLRDPEMAELDKQRQGFRQFLEREKQKKQGRGRGYQKGGYQGRGRGYQKGGRGERDRGGRDRKDERPTRDNRSGKYAPKYKPKSPRRNQLQTPHELSQTNVTHYQTRPQTFGYAPRPSSTVPAPTSPSTGLPPTRVQTGLPPMAPLLKPATLTQAPTRAFQPPSTFQPPPMFQATKTDWKKKRTIL